MTHGTTADLTVLHWTHCRTLVSRTDFCWHKPHFYDHDHSVYIFWNTWWNQIEKLRYTFCIYHTWTGRIQFVLLTTLPLKEFLVQKSIIWDDSLVEKLFGLPPENLWHCWFNNLRNEMVPTGGTDLVYTYGFHVSNFGGGVNLDPYFRTLYPILDIFHFGGG